MNCDLATLREAAASGDPEQLQQISDACTAALTDPKLWLWLLVIALVGAAVGAWIGRRNRTVARDAWLGFLLGPIGWIVSLMLRPKPPGAAK